MSSGTHSDVRVSHRTHTAEQHADAELIQIVFDTPNNSEDTEAHTEGLDDPERLTDTLGHAARAVAVTEPHRAHSDSCADMFAHAIFDAEVHSHDPLTGTPSAKHSPSANSTRTRGGSHTTTARSQTRARINETNDSKSALLWAL